MSSSFFSNIFGQRPASDEPSASVLAEWNKYSGDTAGALMPLPDSMSCSCSHVHKALPSHSRPGADLCPAPAAPSASDRLASRMEEGGATVQTFMAGALARLSTGVQGVGQTVGAGVQTWVLHPSLPFETLKAQTKSQTGPLPLSWSQHAHAAMPQETLGIRATVHRKPWPLSCLLSAGAF